MKAGDVVRLTGSDQRMDVVVVGSEGEHPIVGVTWHDASGSPHNAFYPANLLKVMSADPMGRSLPPEGADQSAGSGVRGRHSPAGRDGSPWSA